MIQKRYYYLNLTNGLEKLKDYPDAHFVRIQSTHVEQKNYEAILMQLDSDFLLRLSTGHKCIVIDGSNKKSPSKALRMGINIIKYILYRLWFDKFIKIDKVDPKYLDFVYYRLSKHVKTKLKYFKKFLKTNNIDLNIEAFQTKNDGNYKFYASLIE